MEEQLYYKDALKLAQKDYRACISSGVSPCLPVLDDFLAEWGIRCTPTLVKDTEQFIETDGEDGTVIITDYNELETSYGYEIYGEYVELDSAPKVVVGDTGHIECTFGDATGTSEAGTPNTSRVFDSFLYSSDASQDYGKNSVTGEHADDGEVGRKTVAAISGRKTMDSETGNNTYSYLFCAASADFFSETYLGNASYANYDVVSGLVQNIARLDTYASSELGGVSMNNSDDNFLGKMLVEEIINEEDKEIKEWNDETSSYHTVKTYYGLTPAAKTVYSIIIALIPFSIAIVGTVVCVRRKYK